MNVFQLAGYSIDNFIGDGAYGSVYEATRLSDGRKVAIKRILYDLVPDELDDVLREVSFMATVGEHPNLVRFYEAFVHPGPTSIAASQAPATRRMLPSLCIAQEFVDGGTLATIMRDSGAPLSEDEAAAAICDVVHALAFLHDECRIVHRDVKCNNNLFFVGEGGPCVKVCDFGASGAVAAPSVARHTVIGTPGWMAPEILSQLRGDATAVLMHAATPAGAAALSAAGAARSSGGQAGYSFPSDIWSLGVTTLEALLAKSPQEDPAFSVVISHILRTHYSTTSSSFTRSQLHQQQGSPSSATSAASTAAAAATAHQASLGIDRLDRAYSPLCRDFIVQCLNPDPQRRPTARALLQHPFILRQTADGGRQRHLGLTAIAKRVSAMKASKRPAPALPAAAQQAPPKFGPTNASGGKQQSVAGGSSQTFRAALRPSQIFYTEADVERAAIHWAPPPASYANMVVPPASLASGSKSAFERVLMSACRRTSAALHRIVATEHAAQRRLATLDSDAVPAPAPDFDAHHAAMDELVIALRRANDAIPNFTQVFCSAFADVTLQNDEDRREVERRYEETATRLRARPPVSSHKLPPGELSPLSSSSASGTPREPFLWYGNPRMVESTGMGGTVALLALPPPPPPQQVGNAKRGAGGPPSPQPPHQQQRRQGGAQGAMQQQHAQQAVNVTGVLFNAWLDQAVKTKFEGPQAMSYTPFH